MTIFLELVVVLGAMIIGIRLGSAAMGMMGCLGLMVLATVFNVAPTSPPVDVLLIIFAVVTAAGCMEACGGLNYLVKIASRIIRSNPRFVTILAPLVAYAFTIVAGTANIIFALHPVMYEVAYSQKVRPERVMANATLAGQFGIVASPISAAMGAMIGLFAGYDLNSFGLTQIWMISLPATFIAVIVTSCIMMFYGKELKDDPEYQRRLKAGLIEPPEVKEFGQIDVRAKISVLIFCLAVLVVMLAGFFPQISTIGGKTLGTSTIIECVMMAAGGVIILVCRPSLTDVVESPTFKSGISSISIIFGIAWLADSFIQANNAQIMAVAGNIVEVAPWAFTFVLWVMCVMLQSQAAATRAIMPLGLAIGLSPEYLIAMFPAVCGIAILPIAGPLLSAVSFDRTGTTHIGKYLINHSFFVPMVLLVAISVSAGFILVNILF